MERPSTIPTGEGDREPAGTRPDLCLVLPVHDEAATIPEALEALSSFAHDAGILLHVVVADDGSSDGTPDVVRAWRPSAQARPPSIELVRTARRGRGAVVRAAMQRARGPVVGYCSTDLAGATDVLGRMYAAVVQGRDVAIASRAGNGDDLPLTGRLYNWWLRRSTGLGFRDTQVGLKLFRGAAAEQIFRRQRVEGTAAEAEVLVLAGRLGLDVEEVPLPAKAGPAGPLIHEVLELRRDTLRIVRDLRRGRDALGVPAPEAMATMAGAEDSHWWYVVKRRLVRELIVRHALPGPCLDVGCGAGATMMDLACVRPTFGVDLSPQALAHARTRGLTGLVCSEGGALPFAAGSFGSVLALDVLEHCGTPEQLLREIRRVLQPGGLLVVGVPAYQWMWSYADHLLGHYRRYTKGPLDAELAESGFETERLTYVHSWLVPVAWGFRRVKALLGLGMSTDEFAMPESLNRLFLGLGLAEIRFVSRRSLPFGLSLFALARPALGVDPTDPPSGTALVQEPGMGPNFVPTS